MRKAIVNELDLSKLFRKDHYCLELLDVDYVSGEELKVTLEINGDIFSGVLLFQGRLEDLK